MLKITTILLLGLAFRVYGINWDQGFHLHPDERMLIMVAERIHFPTNFNPDFFNYGTLPIYILKGVAQLLDMANYDGLLALGRYLSVLTDVVVVYLVYKIAQIIFKSETKALFSSFFYAIAFFPIQNAHFFVVDVYLNLFVTALLYLLLLYYQKPSLKKTVLLGVVAAAALATKITAIVWLPIVVITLILTPPWRGKDLWRIPVLAFARDSSTPIKSGLGMTILFIATTVVFHFLFMPYAYLSYQRFFTDIYLQTQMNSNPYIFPYTLQYVDTLPYLYYLKNIFLWGWGPIVSSLSLVGIVYIIKSKIKYQKSKLQIKIQKCFFPITNYGLLVTFVFYGLYFLIIGQSAVKFMRYMLPLYPLFALLAGYGLHMIMSFLRKQESSSGSRVKPGMTIIVVSAGLLAVIVWTLMFLSIYSKPHTRITATNWILQNIPPGSTLAVEHWDDRLPLIGGERYTFQELTLYDLPDGEEKWQTLNKKLALSDYIIIASNRLYVPLQRLKDCKKYKSCYSKTAQYYEDLFSGKLGFQKIAEFTSYPKLEIRGWKLEINDDASDESFTVYDHPKVMIFKKG